MVGNVRVIRLQTPKGEPAQRLARVQIGVFTDPNEFTTPQAGFEKGTHNGKAITIECVASRHAVSWPHQVAFTDESLERELKRRVLQEARKALS